MGKRILNLYTDDELIVLAKAKGINLSAFFTELLAAFLKQDENEDGLNDKEKILKLQANNALLSNALHEKTEEVERYLRKIREFKNELEDLKEKLRKKETKKERVWIQ